MVSEASMVPPKKMPEQTKKRRPEKAIVSGWVWLKGFCSKDEEKAAKTAKIVKSPPQTLFSLSHLVRIRSGGGSRGSSSSICEREGGRGFEASASTRGV